MVRVAQVLHLARAVLAARVPVGVELHAHRPERLLDVSLRRAAYQLPKNSSNKMWQQPGPYTAKNGTISLQQPVCFHSKMLGSQLIH